MSHQSQWGDVKVKSGMVTLIMSAFLNWVHQNVVLRFILLLLLIITNTKGTDRCRVVCRGSTRQKPGRYVGVVSKQDRKISYSLQHSEQHQGHHQCTQRRARADERQLGQNKLFLRTPLGQEGKVVVREREERGECCQMITGLIHLMLSQRN